MLGHLHLALLTASIGLVGANGSPLADAIEYPVVAVADSGTTIQLGPTFFEVNADDLRIAEMYVKLHDVGNFLHTRGLSREAISILEELGDLALSRGDYDVAANAYEDGAWVASDCARQASGTFSDYTVGTSRPKVRNAFGLTKEAERLLQKAEEAAAGSG